MFSNNLIKEENWLLTVKKVTFEFGTLIRFFFRVLEAVEVATGLFPKTFVGDVDIVFALHVTIC